MRRHWINILVLIILFVGMVGWLTAQKNRKLRNIENQTVEKLLEEFRAATTPFTTLAKLFYEQSNEALARTMQIASTGDAKTRHALREKILDRFYPMYRNGTLLGLMQMQVHDPEGRSFVRFRHSELFGDDLTSIRPSIRNMVRSHRFLEGCEAGRYSFGYRHIFPLFYDGKYTGSVEWVWRSIAVTGMMSRLFGGDYGIVIPTEELNETMSPETIRDFSEPFPLCPDFRIEKTHAQYDAIRFRKTLRALQIPATTICTALKQDSARILHVAQNGQYKFLVILPIRDIDTNRSDRLIAIKNDPYSATILSTYHRKLRYYSLLMLLLIGIIYLSYRKEMFVRTLLDSQKDLVVLTSGSKLYDANRSFLEFFGVKNIKEFLRTYGCVCRQFLAKEGYYSSHHDDARWIEALSSHSGQEKRVIMRSPIDGKERIFLVSVRRFGKTGLHVVSFRDITELEREKRHLQLESVRDHLTQIYNKRAFEHYLREKIQDYRTFHRFEVSVVMFDLDDFKRINDTYGHTAGDRVLRRLTRIVRGQIRKSDFFARWGGDEFMIVMEGIEPAQAARIMDKIRLSVENADFGVPERITCSFGITAIGDNDTLIEIIERVDKLLYQAKEKGKNQIVWDTGGGGR